MELAERLAQGATADAEPFGQLGLDECAVGAEFAAGDGGTQSGEGLFAQVGALQAQERRGLGRHAGVLSSRS